MIKSFQKVSNKERITSQIINTKNLGSVNFLAERMICIFFFLCTLFAENLKNYFSLKKKRRREKISKLGPT